MKSELSHVARQYATALFEITSVQGTAEAVLADLENINATLEATSDFKLVLNHPAVPIEEKKKLLVGQFQGHVTEISLCLVEMLVDRRRMELIPYIAVQYRECLEQAQGIIHATLVSAHTVSAAELDSIKMVLTKKLRKEPKMEVKVDPSLIAGMQLAVGDQILDGSIKTQLANLERSLMSV
jgi:F-type H+-transporting ATPase subunit delta